MMKKVLPWILIGISLCFNLFFLRSVDSKSDAQKNKTIIDTLIIIRTDTLVCNHEIYIDSIRELKEDLTTLRDSVRFYRDKMNLDYNCYDNARKVEKSKYYISICDKNESQKKYFFGWIKRTMSE